MLSQQLFFLSILIFSAYYKFSIITLNIFTNLILSAVMRLSKLTCFREFFIMFISQNSMFLCSSLNAYITFQLCQTMLLLKSSDVSFFTNSVCIFAMLSIIALNVSTSNIKTNYFKSISQTLGKIVNSFSLIFLIVVIWQFNTICIAAFLSVTFTMVVNTSFHTCIALIF